MARGSVYKKKTPNKGDKQASPYWYLKYPDGRGGYIAHSARTRDKTKAQRLLREKMRIVDEGGTVNTDTVDLPFSALREAIILDYELRGLKSLRSVKHRFTNHLDDYFGHLQVVQIQTKDVKEYQRARKDAGAAHATINKEVALIKRGFKLLQEDHPNLKIPKAPKLEEDNARQGFATVEDLERLLQALPAHLRGLVTAAFWTGWRRAELLGLKWADVDLDRMEVSIKTSKNGKGRRVHFRRHPMVSAAIQRQHAYTQRVRIETGKISPHVFHRDGKQIKDFRESWKQATEAADREGLLFHDLRRSAVRNMEHVGVPRSTAMSITGHETESIYARYSITNEASQDDAFSKLATLAQG